MTLETILVSKSNAGLESKHDIQYLYLQNAYHHLAHSLDTGKEATDSAGLSPMGKKPTESHLSGELRNDNITLALRL